VNTSFDHRHYVPCLRWKQGEYKAVSLLSAPARDLITPLIEVPEKGYDFETQSDKKTIDEHLAPFAKRVRTTWQQRPCFVDLKLISPEERMDSGIHPVKYVFEELNAQGCAAIPVTAPDRDLLYQRAVRQAATRDKRGLCVRVGLEEAAKPDFKSTIGTLIGEHIAVEECDLILDLGAPNFIPLDGFAELVGAVVDRLPFLARWRTFAVIGTAFPPTMAVIKTSPVEVPRNEWLLFKKLVRNLTKAKLRLPAFGDYVINHPAVLQLDMRLLKPSGTLRYTGDDSWTILKGPNVRDHNFTQYVDHCKSLMGLPVYRGSTFSKGDEYISECARRRVSTGNLSTWRWVGTNQHLEKVARDVASLFAA